MARIALIGLEPPAASQLADALHGEFHQIENKPQTVRPAELSGYDIVFANGDGARYMPLLQGVREMEPALPFVVVTRVPDTSDWLDALEAGATDYCSAPFEARQMKWLLETALHPTLKQMAAA